MQLFLHVLVPGEKEMSAMHQFLEFKNYEFSQVIQGANVYCEQIQTELLKCG